jgi:hypothetical protein
MSKKYSEKVDDELILIEDPIHGEIFFKQSKAFELVIGLLIIGCIWIILLILYFLN